MRIGIDVDDVVADCAAPYARAYAAEFGLDFGAEPLGWHLLDADESVPRRLKEDFRVRLYDGDFFAGLECFPGTIEGVRALRDAGLEIHFITARAERRRAVTETWLARQGLLEHAAAVHLRPRGDFIPRAYDARGSAAYKVERARTLGLDAFCEDDPVIARSLAEAGVRVLLFDRPWNRDLAHPLVTRVLSWDDVLRAVVPPA